MVAAAGLPLNLSHFAVVRLPGASPRGGGVAAGGRAGAAAEHAGQGLFPGAGGELAEALPLARDPGAAAEGLVDGLGGGADGGLDVLPRWWCSWARWRRCAWRISGSGPMSSWAWVRAAGPVQSR